MNGFSIEAWRGGRYLSLADLLSVLGPQVRPLKWRLRTSEVAPSPGAPLVESLGADQLVDTQDILKLFPPSVQIVDGEICGHGASGELVLRIRAVDSTWWDIETDDSQLLRAIAEAFPDAIKLP